MRAVVAVVVAGLASAASARPPNIVLVMADDQGWGDMGYAGHPVVRTPHFDAMAAEGVRFERFYAAAPVCSPTRGSVLTGRHPNRFGCFQWGHSLRPQEVTLAEVLREAGYRTGHFGKWHLGSVRSGSPVNPGASGFDVWVSAENFFDNDPILSVEGKAVPMEGESSMVTVDRALEFIRESAADGERPFFAVVWFGSPHLPHRAAPEDRRLYDGEPEKVRDFYGEITGMDRAFGRLREGLGELGIRDDTLLWYCSDNGALPAVGSSGGRRGHKGQVWEGGLLVPSLLEWPARFPQPREIAARGNTSDLMPTVLELAGIGVPGTVPRLDGISLVPVIAGESDARPVPMGFWHHPAGGIRTPSAEWMRDLLAAQQAGREPDEPAKLRLDAGAIAKQYPDDRFPGHAAWIDGDWKLHRIEDRDGRVSVELYDLANDPAEERDLAGVEGERVKSLGRDLEAWLRSVVASLNGGDYTGSPP